MPPVLQRWLPVALVAACALGLRTWNLDRRPMHADEANQACKAGQLLEGRGYSFDPADHHGPTLYYAVLPVAWLRGERTLAGLTETTVRLVPALAGTAAVLLLCGLALSLGRWPALAAAAFLAVSPPAVYYSRYFVQETLLLAFTLGAIFCTAHWWRGGRLGWAIGAGICAGLMQATKAAAPLFLVVALAGLAFARPPRPASTRIGCDIGAALLAALFIAALFYSSFGAHLPGLADAFSTYSASFSRLSGTTGHEKPWWYYFTLFGWHRAGGVTTQQLLFSLVAILGLVLALRPGAPRLLRAAAAYVAVVGLVLSIIPYKTPWHAIHLVPGLAVLAAGGLSLYPGRRFVAIALAVLVVLFQGEQVRLTSFLRSADERNPYAYVHTSPDVLKLRPLAVAAQTEGRTVRIISEEIWPLPWYLRGLSQVGYWTSVPDDCDGALVIASAGLAEQVRSRLHGNYETGFVGLRPGFTLVVFKRQP
ncbi:MAG: flippase activity-associated protein Agl23 [Verrucomicrobiota bacterium]